MHGVQVQLWTLSCTQRCFQVLMLLSLLGATPLSLHQAKRIIKTQTTTRVENVEVKQVDERDPWTLPMSIFKPRLKETDARAFFDTPQGKRHSRLLLAHKQRRVTYLSSCVHTLHNAALEKMFEKDWLRACGKEKFTSMMIRENKSNKATPKVRQSQRLSR